MQKKTFITKAEAARKCGLSRLAVYSLIDLGIIEVDHKGRIFRAPFMAWLSNRTGASSDDE